MPFQLKEIDYVDRFIEGFQIENDVLLIHDLFMKLGLTRNVLAFFKKTDLTQLHRY